MSLGLSNKNGGGGKETASASKASIVRSTAIFGTANYAVQFIGLINSVALRKFMGPLSMGVWSILQVVLDYCGYASFGTTRAMARDYPYFCARGEGEKATRLRNLVVTFSMIMSIIPAVILWVYLTAQWNKLTSMLKYGLCFMSFFIFIQRFYDVVIGLLRCEKKFILLSKLKIINALAGLTITLALVSWLNIYGLLIGTAAVTAGCLLFVYQTNPYPFQFFWDRQELLKTLTLGIPLVAAGFLTTFLSSLDKLIIAKYLGFKEVGFYSIAMMANSYVFSFPMIFSNVWFPHLQEEYGRRTTPEGIKNYLLLPVRILSIVIPLMAGTAIFLAPVLVHIFIPRFSEGIAAMKIYLAGTFFLFLGQLATQFLVTLDKQLLNLPVLGASIVSNALLNLLFVKSGWGIEGVALGTVISFAVYGFLSYILALRNFQETGAMLLHVFRLFGKLSILFGAAIFIDQALRGENLYVVCLWKLAAFILLAAPFLWYLERRTSLLRHLKENIFVKPK